MSFSTDRCVYVGQFMGVTCYILLYVDDMILGTPNRTIMSQLKNRIDAKFPIKDQGPIYFWLNMYNIRNRSEGQL
jgi:hypothetical protein